MNKKNITIITGTGGALGTGHFQRMCYLGDSLNLMEQYSVKLHIAEGSPSVPGPLQDLLTDSVPGNTDLIIRDMRDSSADEIKSLQQTAPVLVVDDTGPGRVGAAHVIDLLPNPLNSRVPGKIFLYGYNFVSEIKSLRTEVIAKDIDVAIYAGYKPEPSVVESIYKLIPADASVVLFSRGRPSILSEKKVGIDSGYTDLLLRSRVLITHFGITMYEGDLAGCRVLSVNPTPYHSELAGMVTRILNVVPAGEYGKINNKLVYSEITHCMQRSGLKIVSRGSISERININFNYFMKVFNTIISGGE